VDCTAPLNRYTCYGAIEVVAIIIIIIIIIIITHVDNNAHRKWNKKLSYCSQIALSII